PDGHIVDDHGANANKVLTSFNAIHLRGLFEFGHLASAAGCLQPRPSRSARSHGLWSTISARSAAPATQDDDFKTLPSRWLSCAPADWHKGCRKHPTSRSICPRMSPLPHALPTRAHSLGRSSAASFLSTNCAPAPYPSSQPPRKTCPDPLPPKPAGFSV